MTTERVEIENGLVLPSWFLRVMTIFGGSFVAWAIWVTNTLIGLSYKLDTVHDDRRTLRTHTEAIATERIQINELFRRVERLENGR